MDMLQQLLQSCVPVYRFRHAEVVNEFLFQFSDDGLLLMLEQKHLCRARMVRSLETDGFFDGLELFLQRDCARDNFLLLGQERVDRSAGKV
jgi:hypothetical protein